MKTFQIHIAGVVQGVGFRPFIYNLACKMNLSGWVSNTSSGVYIQINGDEKVAEQLLNEIIVAAPKKSIITSHSIKEVAEKDFDQFSINESFEGENDDRIITPDYAICDKCIEELKDPGNRRYNYAFITCSHCGPRYSIIKDLPYDREQTSMQAFNMCEECKKEYKNPNDRRFYSQTNSCPTCGINLSLYDYEKGDVFGDSTVLIKKAYETIEQGKIIAVKGIGGYMLMADATNPKTIQLLRQRKHRPHKPFAVMVKDVEMLQEHASLSSKQEEYFLSDSAPIVLLESKKDSSIVLDEIAPELNEIGLLRPYSPLHYQLMAAVNRPLIATSGNLSGSPIIFEDDKVVDELKGIADMILMHDRKIIAPQDDSVIRFTKDDQAIVIRRSRGIAPNFIRNKENNKKSILAMGAMLKSTFTLLYKGNSIVSQYIGNSNSYETQLNYVNDLSHVEDLLDFSADLILSDKHPGYFTSELAEELAIKLNVKNYKIQHHEAHFTAVLGEHQLWDSEVLGFVWDGTGLGNDDNIWGGEVFYYKDNQLKRMHHLPYQKHILGDKMVNETRISALSFFHNISGSKEILRKKFNDLEWDIYSKQYDSSALLTSSMGRLFDAVASVLGIINISSFHGQAAMLLEASALRCKEKYSLSPFSIFNDKNEFELTVLLEEIITAIDNGLSVSIIAARFHHSLVTYIEWIAGQEKCKKLSFSGGVFQNKLLVELINEKLKPKYELYFHKELSPNDESISFGQLMHYLHITSNKPPL